jgi:hypothetical protein
LTIVCCICDEIAHWESSDLAANPDIEILRVLEPSLITTRGQLILISTQWCADGAFYDLCTDYWGDQGGDDVLVVRGETAARCDRFTQIACSKWMEGCDKNPTRERANDGMPLTLVYSRRAGGGCNCDSEGGSGEPPRGDDPIAMLHSIVDYMLGLDACLAALEAQATGEPIETDANSGPYAGAAKPGASRPIQKKAKRSSTARAAQCGAPIPNLTNGFQRRRNTINSNFSPPLWPV